MVFLVGRFPADANNRVDMIGHNHMLPRHHLRLLDWQHLKRLPHTFAQLVQYTFPACNRPPERTYCVQLESSQKIAPYHSRYSCFEVIDEKAFSAYQRPAITTALRRSCQPHSPFPDAVPVSSGEQGLPLSLPEKDTALLLQLHSVN